MSDKTTNHNLNIWNSGADHPMRTEFTQNFNKIDEVLGKYSDLPTMDKTSAVNAIKEIYDALKSVEGGASGADYIAATDIPDLAGSTVQALITSLRNKLKETSDGISGADFVNATSIPDLEGTTVQTLIEAIRNKLKSVTDGSSGGDFIKMTPLEDTGSADTPQSILESLVSKLKSSAAAAFLGATSIPGLIGSSVQSLLTSLKGYTDGHINDINANINNLSFTGSSHDALVTGSLVDAEGENFGPGGTATYLNGRLDKWEQKTITHMAENMKIWVNLFSTNHWKNRLNDASGINNALADSDTKTLYIPDGDYVINSPILIPNNKRIIFGENAIIYRNFNSGTTENATIRNNDPINGNQNIEICGGTFRSNETMLGKHLGFDNVTNLKIFNTTILGIVTDWNTSFKRINGMILHGLYIDSGREIGTDGIHISSGNNIVISDCIILCGDDAIALSIENDTEGNIENVNITNCHCYASAASPIRLLVSGSTKKISKVNISNITGKCGSGTALKIEDLTNNKLIENVVLANITLDCSTNTDKGCNVQSVTLTTLKNVTILNSYNNAFAVTKSNDVILEKCRALTTRNSSVYGFHITASAGVTLIGCLVDGAKGHGIYFSTSGGVGVVRGKIVNCISRNNTWGGIALDTSTRNKIIGNDSYSNGQWGCIETNTASDYNIIANNDFSGNIGGGLSKQGANTVTVNNL